MWSDEARAAAAEARKKGHASAGNRKVAKKAKEDHKKPGLITRWTNHLQKGEDQAVLKQDPAKLKAQGRHSDLAMYHQAKKRAKKR